MNNFDPKIQRHCEQSAAIQESRARFIQEYAARYSVNHTTR
jgi:hypothetical protein